MKKGPYSVVSTGKPRGLMRYRSIILIILVKGSICNVAFSLTLREESRLRVFENRILRRSFGPKRDENGEWRRLHNEELHSLYCLPNIG